MQSTVELDMDDGALTKKQIRDNPPKRIRRLQFGIPSSNEIVKQGVVEVSNRNVYDLTGSKGPQRSITKHGPLDTRMGVSNNSSRCETCQLPLKHCNGHFGYVKLALPAFHIGFLKKIMEILHSICKECGQVLLEDKVKRNFLKSLRKSSLDAMEHKAIVKKIMTECRKTKFCPYCDEVNGTVKKVQGHALKLIHEKFRWYNASTAKNKVAPASKDDFDASFVEARKTNPDVEKHFRKAVDDLHPLRVLNLFKKISDQDCELVGMGKGGGKPEQLIWQYVPAPPVVIRPSVLQEGASTEDDVTNKLGDIIQISSLIRAGLKKGQPIQTIMEQWDFLQIQVALYVNSETPNMQQAGFGKPIRGFCQRLKGKQGRFRGNLSGKRVDFSGRTVISPDPNLGIDEVAVPKRVARNLTYPEKVTARNFERLLAAVANGPHKWPGANSVEKQNGSKISLHGLAKSGNLARGPANVKFGDTVHRHLTDGDIVLFNRQPSLHKLSILAHRVKVRNWRTFRLNECVCTPYNADFDGDEMNLHVPQTEEARVEATELMGVKHNLATPKDGTPIIAATQDFITAAYLLSNRDRFYDRKSFCQIVSFMFDGDAVRDADDGVITLRDVDIPPPTIIKPERLWTGKQVFNVLMRPTAASNIKINFDAHCKQFVKVQEQTNNTKLFNREFDDYVVVRNSEVLSGVMDKSVLGSGKKDSIFYVLLRDYGPDAAVQGMNRLAKLAARWLGNEGFSIGINDVYPDEELRKNNRRLIGDAYLKADELIQKFKVGSIERDPGCDEEMTMENRISGILSRVRERAGALCLEHLSTWNSPVIMAKSGSKGSNINVAQMVATVGQQVINSARVEDGFQDRTLPHFPKAARQPPSKGFVANSFFSGLSPTEFIFHAMSGREGLVDTAVKTAETGYMSRRLMKSLEDLSAQYDETVRNASSGIVQFAFGEDGLDPVDMEGSKGKPVNLDRTFMHAQVSTWSLRDRCLLPEEIRTYTENFLEPHKRDCVRVNLSGEQLDYDDDSPMAIDRFESKRKFIFELESYLAKKAQALEEARRTYILKKETSRKRKAAAESAPTDEVVQGIVDGLAKMSQTTLDTFLTMCMRKYIKAKVEPGHAVGAVGAQSIGEPGTQMTLKTFHFAGVAGMSLTQGVPRIKEIINGSRVISTPVISCELDNPYNVRAAQAVKARIEKTYLRDILVFIEQIWLQDNRILRIHIDLNAVEELELDMTIDDVRKAILSAKGIKLEPGQVRSKSRSVVTIYPDKWDAKTARARARASAKAPGSEDDSPYFKLQQLMRQLPNIHIKGYPEASRAIITRKDKGEKKDANDDLEENKLLVEGNGFRACLNTPGVDARRTTTNNIAEVYETLGIEAARSTIIAELKAVMGDSMEIDPRHMQLLADVMTFRGMVLGITRFGLAKMRDSVLQLASFEKTPDHLFEAAIRAQEDRIEGVSECIIMGQSMTVGTGAMKVTRPLGLTANDMRPLPTLFEGLCNG